MKSSTIICQVLMALINHSDGPLIMLFSVMLE